MEPLKRVTSTIAVIPAANIDTDQIIPARFLKVTDKVGLGAHLFAGWRTGPDGSPRADFALNRPEAKGAAILVAGANFGCGSSREHAPWALVDAGFRAVISTSVADIFRSNALKNGLLPVVVDAAAHAELLTSAGLKVTVDLEAEHVLLPSGARAPFTVDRFSRHCLLNGIDELGFLLGHDEGISRYERASFGDGGNPCAR